MKAKRIQQVATAVNVNAPSTGWCPVPFTMFPFSNVALNFVPFEASNVQVLLPLSISPLTIPMKPCTSPKILQQQSVQKIISKYLKISTIYFPSIYYFIVY